MDDGCNAADLVGYDKPVTGDYILVNGQTEILSFSSGPEGFTKVWSPATDMTTAFSMLGKIKELPFSRRARFWVKIDVRLGQEGAPVSWPCALLYLTPMAVAKAAILASVPRRPKEGLS